MISDETVRILEEDIQSAETVEELQTHVLIANQHLETSSEIETAGSDHNSQRVEALTEWMSSIRTRMEELAEGQDVTSYSVTVGGGLTGPSISISVTSSLETE